MPREDPCQQLIEDIILLFCVMFAELDQLKRVFARKYVMNCAEIRAEVRKEKGLGEFVRKYGYAMEEEQVKYLQCYLNRKFDLADDKAIRMLFLPVYDNEEESQNTQNHQSKTYSKTKPDFLKFKLANGTQIITK
jgi:hypothetical protein